MTHIVQGLAFKINPPFHINSICTDVRSYIRLVHPYAANTFSLLKSYHYTRSCKALAKLLKT